MPGHVHGVVQVEVSVCVQDGVTPAAGQMFSRRTYSNVFSLVFTGINIILLKAFFHLSYQGEKMKVSGGQEKGKALLNKRFRIHVTEMLF